MSKERFWGELAAFVFLVAFGYVVFPLQEARSFTMLLGVSLIVSAFFNAIGDFWRK